MTCMAVVVSVTLSPVLLENIKINLEKQAKMRGRASGTPHLIVWCT